MDLTMMERVGDREEKMEGSCSTCQRPQWVGVPVEEEEEEEEGGGEEEEEEEEQQQEQQQQQQLNSVISCLSRSLRFIKLIIVFVRLQAKFLEIAGLKETFLSDAACV
jgi:CO dehydrogenase/acetyl-CoA synthase beta subunit